MDEIQEDDMMGMVGSALDDYQNVNDDDNKKHRNKKIFDYYDY